MTEPQAPVALYIHLPFCVARCPYCDFVVYAGSDARGPRARTGRLYDAVARELELRAGEWRRLAAAPLPAAAPLTVATPREGAPRGGDAPRDGDAPLAPDERRRPLASVYFGGGTPSLAPVAVVERLLRIASDRFGIENGAEITLEMNPGPGERGDLAGFARAGVNRVSIGAQSLDPAELRRLGRRHSPGDVASAVDETRAVGIGSVNIDLLYDLPGQSVANWERTLRAALDLEPDHLSLYALTLDDPEAEGLAGDAGDHLPTPSGARRWRDLVRREQDDDRAAAQYRLAHELLGSLGWRPYEISNWSRPGHESRHNLAYWRRIPYEAVGPGAHAFDGITRRWNAAAMMPYVAALEAGRLPPGGSEVPDHRAAAAEEAILALRLDTGIAAATAVDEPLAGVVAWGLELGLLERVEIGSEPRLRLTVDGRLLSNELFARLV